MHSMASIGIPSGGAVIASHDRRRVLDGGERLPVKRSSCHFEAVYAGRQGNAGLCRTRPDIRGDIDAIGVVVATARDCPDVRPAFKCQTDGGPAGGAELDIDLFAASVRPMFELRQFTVIELNGVTFEE